jgi:chorismate-pyruvate lyase
MRGTPELEPLAAFRSLPRFQFVEPAELPEPYRGLLVHERDMTSTLGEHHRDTVRLRVLRSRNDHDEYLREVVLVSETSGRPVEYGAIRITLGAFPADAQQLIRAAQRPLGAIMDECGINYTCRPKAFFRVETDAAMNEALGLPASRTLYGRCNEIRDSQGRTLADIVEILPP